MDASETLNVLLIEDNPADSEFIEDLLEDVEPHYFSIDIAEQLSDGIAQCVEKPYDAVLLDLALPDSTGAETFETLSRRVPHVPIIILTGLEDRSLALELVRSGAQDYLVKGHFDYDRIERSIRYAIERMQAEQELRQRTEELQRVMAMVDLANDSIIVLDLTDRITYWNHGAERLYGWTAREAEGEVINSFLHTSFPQPLQGVKETLFATGGWTGELTHRTRNGENIIVECHQTLQYDQAGNPSAIFEITTNITDRRRAQEELKRHSEQLEALVAERTAQLKDAERLSGIGETAAMIGHDLRNPLQALQYMVDLQKLRFQRIHSEKLGADFWETEQELFDRISEQIFYMDKIVGDLQDYARPITPERETVSIEMLINDVLQSLPDGDGVAVITNLTGLAVEADYHLMRRVFANLVLNAMQAMSNGGRLSVDGVATDNSVIIHVSDTGVGIPADMHDKVFSPLTTGKAKGTGLGLAVVKRIVKAHNGTITFESEEGKGTTFTITIPQTVE
ncbi:MAG: ATP-binding protein [Halobacteriota archaeon]